MNRYEVNKKALVVSLITASFMTSPVFAFNSGSTGADGAFSPTVTTTVQLPPSGIFNYTTVNIPSGVTVTYTKNTTNTPVVILGSGNVTIAGAITLSGTKATDVGAAGDGNLGDDGIPGVGAPGGFDGGRGGPMGGAPARGGDGFGPGGGLGGILGTANVGCGGTVAMGGGGGGFGGGGGNATAYLNTNLANAIGGPAYGASQLLPLIGGSGGGGGSGNGGFGGSGGGGGGGAILIASSGTLNITGTITANGGASGIASGVGVGATGGGGSGGAIRLMATTIAGNGALNAVGSGANGNTNSSCYNGGGGGTGRIRLEAETITRTAASNPQYPAVTAPTTVFVAGLPTLRITTVAGVAAPAAPTGNADITLPVSTPNPVTVEFATTGVPVGNTVKLTVTPTNSASVTATTPALTGTIDSATASVSVNLPSGPNVLQATVSYTVVASVGDLLGVQFAKGERVKQVTLVASLKGPTMMTLTTVSGKEYTVSSTQVAGILGS